MKSLRQYISETERAFGITKYLTEDLHDVIVKVGDYWRIKGHAGKGTNTPKRGYWKAKYKTREKAENALKAYFANKG